MIREVDLISYLPEFMKKYKELTVALGAENPEFLLAWKEADNCLKNRFISTADEYGVSRYEKMLEILPQIGDSLDNRKAIILAKYNTRSLYTFFALKEMLSAAVGKENYTIFYFPEQYQIRIQIVNQDIVLVKGIYKTINTLLPVQMIVLFYAEYQENVKIKLSQSTRIKFITEFYPQFNLRPLHLDRTWKLDGKQKLSGYDGFGRIELYPVRVKIQTKTGETPKTKTQVVFLSKAKEEIKNSQNIEVKTSAEIKRKVSERITMPALTTVCTKTKTQAVFLLKTKEQIECNQNIKIRTSMICQKRTGERVTIQTSAAVSTGTEEMMNNRNVLNGKWKLNGKRKLNGGKYQL